MKVSELVKYMGDVDPELEVVIRSDDSDFDYATLLKKQITVDYVQTVDVHSKDEPIEKKMLILGDLFA